ncbi:fumarylacetoacetate hydrolase family protein [Aureimonas fodinaquatilis]|uniref:Fumarylacetoacetate hydrolase family protein n=1 Tax=Aureimonas fodinaquatilis TaxID=2565783 RepID=A0A5B0DUJ0_9HYPH|nr:fumarylacetoacetate hydrolase family protein [Aureimonas fodinaquatilis]KAA0970103.1 fumarylacetoacetate hydrolase family protein [Aureimonas fodinaquatilis]
MADIWPGANETLPEDADKAALAGRVWRPDLGGPAIVAIRNGDVVDISAAFPTMRDLCEAPDPAAALREATGETLGSFADLLANAHPDKRDATKPWLLAPVDLQALKAAGVTFVVSMLERVIEERAKGDPSAARSIREEIGRLIGTDLQALRPGSPEAMALKKVLIEKGVWSQYLEVGIGPDAEIFTKAQILSSVGSGQLAGVRPDSAWNNPEPEIVLAISSAGKIVGATLGNDVNLRDFEGRSALLLSKAKDNNASCAIGPVLRFFDGEFSLDDVRKARLDLTVTGQDGFKLSGFSLMDKISRDPADLASQALNDHHAYPDGLVLFLGTLFAPTDDRDVEGEGFTHKVGDVVTIRSPRLGALSNEIRSTDACEKWTFAASHLMRNLSKRGLI